jgi:hypothetical protein
MDFVVRSVERVQRFGRQFGPYFLLEMVMPGGTLLALLLLLYRCKRIDIERWMRWATSAVTRLPPIAAVKRCVPA